MQLPHKLKVKPFTVTEQISDRSLTSPSSHNCLHDCSSMPRLLILHAWGQENIRAQPSSLISISWSHTSSCAIQSLTHCSRGIPSCLLLHSVVVVVGVVVICSRSIIIGNIELIPPAPDPPCIIIMSGNME